MSSPITRRIALFAALVALLASVYMLTYSGRIESGDSLMYFNVTGSLVRYGDDQLDLTLWYNPPILMQFDPPYPLKPVELEALDPPLQPVLATWLYWIADHLPGLGLVHTVWLFNILICALAGGVMFLYGLALGYPERTAMMGALALGLATIIWPYSKTFFRDPLALLLILTAGLLLECLRRARFRSPLLILGLGLTLLGGLHTKTTVGFALPGLAVIAFPNLKGLYARCGIRDTMNVALVLLVAVPVVLVFGGLMSTDPDYSLHILGRFWMTPANVRTALHSYLFSIGGSIWGTSPIVLLAIPGIWMIYRQKTNVKMPGCRYIWLALLITLGYAFGYALLTDKNWFGGLSWPPRFILPAVPFLIILTLPVFDRVTHPPVSRWLAAGVALAAVYSLWVQFSGVSVEWGYYSGALPPEARGLTEWGPGLNQIRYLRWVVIPGLWSHVPLDFAWVRVNAPGWAISFMALACACAGILWYTLRHTISRWRLYVTIGSLPVAFVVLAGLGLYSIRADDVYLGGRDSLHQMLDIIDEVSKPGDFVILSDNSYERFFLNYAKLRNPRVITFPVQPGERPSPEQPAQVVSDNPDVLLTRETLGMLTQLTKQRDHLWLLMNTGPFLPWSVRPVERYVASHYYPIREIQTDPPDATVRLIEFSTVDAPDRYAFRGPEYVTDQVFGDSIHLAGYTLPSGTIYTPGSVLPISLYWYTDTALSQDYTVAWKLINQDGNVLAEGADSQPNGGFSPTSTWRAGVPVWDNRAMRLPTDLPPGDYRLWILLYQYDGSIKNLPVSGGEFMGEGKINVLPAIIQIEAQGQK